MRNRLLTTERKSVESYQGITIHADTGVHEQVARELSHLLPKGSTILDVGAGAGAFSRRLDEMGYRVTAVDVDPDKWATPEIPFQVLDVGRGLRASVSGTFDAIACLEVIEHLENPWQFMREALEMVRPGGYLFLSTPNITSFYSRLLFLLRGQFHQFEASDLAYGHINPMTSEAIATAATRAGWSTLSIKPAGYLPILDLTQLSAMSLTVNLLRLWAYLLSRRGVRSGWCVVVVLRRPS